MQAWAAGTRGPPRGMTRPRPSRSPAAPAFDHLAVQRQDPMKTSSEVSMRFAPRLFQAFQPGQLSTGCTGRPEFLLGREIGLPEHIDVAGYPTQDMQVLVSLRDEPRMECAKRCDVALGGVSESFGSKAHDNQRACRARRPVRYSR